MKKILIIIPAYNEEQNIILCKNAIDSALKNLDKKAYNYSVLFVDDGSKDNTLEILENNKLNFISFSRNFGKEAAMLAGFDYAKKENYDAAITMDADLEDDPNVILQLLSKWQEGYSMVLTRHKTRKQNFIKRTLSTFFYKIFSKMCGFENLDQGIRDFGLYDKNVIEAFVSFRYEERFTKGIFAYVGFKKIIIDFDYSKRQYGKSKWSIGKLFKYAFCGINEFCHLYKIHSAIIMFLSAVLFSVDLFYYFINGKFLLSFQTAIILFFIGFMSSAILDVLYEVKEQTRQKPKYFIEREHYNDKD